MRCASRRGCGRLDFSRCSHMASFATLRQLSRQTQFRGYNQFARNREAILSFSLPKGGTHMESIKNTMATLDLLQEEVKRQGDTSVSFVGTSSSTCRQITLSPVDLSSSSSLSTKTRIDSIERFMTKFNSSTLYPKEGADFLRSFADFSSEERKSVTSFFSQEMPDWAWTANHPSKALGKLGLPVVDLLEQWSKIGVHRHQVNYLPLYRLMNNVAYFGGMGHAIYMHDVYDSFNAAKSFWAMKREEELCKLAIKEVAASIRTRSEFTDLVDQTKRDLLYLQKPTHLWDSTTSHFILSAYHALGSLIDLQLFLAEESSYEDIRAMVLSRLAASNLPKEDQKALSYWLMNIVDRRLRGNAGMSSSDNAKASRSSDRVKDKDKIMHILGRLPAIDDCGHTGATMWFTFYHLQKILLHGWNGYITRCLVAKGIGANLFSPEEKEKLLKQ